MNSAIRTRLSAMMFLEYFVPGATLPILSLYLKTRLHFESYQAGIIMAMPAVAAMVAPLAASHIADRYVRAERMLAVCHFLCAGLMCILSRATTFPAFLGLYFLYGVCFTPTFGLTNAVALHHTADAQRDFGGIRMWGTIGWAVVAWIFGYFWLRGGASDGSRLPHALVVSALASCVLSGYALTFPRSRSDMAVGPRVSYGGVLRVFARPSLALLCLTTFLYSACHQVYYFGMGPYLNKLGFPQQYIMPAMSLGQMTEILALALLGGCLARLGMKRALVVGVLAQAARFLIFALEGPRALVLAGIALHGICYAFYFTTAYLYVERHSTARTRAGAQQVLTIVIAGWGTLAGFLLGGYTGQFFTPPGSTVIDYPKFWLVPTALCGLIALLLAVGFREEPPNPHVRDTA